MIQREADVKSKVTAVALTDSVHNVWHQEAGKTIREWMREVRWFFFFFSVLRWMSVSLLYLEPPPTYITSHPQAPFLEAEHLEGIEKTRHGWNNNRKPFGKTITFLEAFLPHPHPLFFFFFEKNICVLYADSRNFDWIRSWSVRLLFPSIYFSHPLCIIDTV